MIDLHLHTNMSDGSDTPLELLYKAVAAGCSVFSVTDHDDLRANAIILFALEQKEYPVKFVTGCEISAAFEGRNLHLLCYGFDPNADCIKNVIQEGARLRRQRIEAMFDHLRAKHGIRIPDDDKADILGRAIPGKVHITDAAMKLGVKMARQEFFDKCLDDMDSREYKLDAEEVIKQVALAGGVISWAHPIMVQKEYRIDILSLTAMAKSLKDIGLVGIEAYHSLHGKQQIDEYKEIAKEFCLKISGGSDYHGKNKEDVRIGKLSRFDCFVNDDEITIL